MDDIADLVWPNRALAIFGVKLVGANADNAKKLLFTLVFLLVVLVSGDVIALDFTQATHGDGLVATGTTGRAGDVKVR
jgi:hypothetical protein